MVVMVGCLVASGDSLWFLFFIFFLLFLAVGGELWMPRYLWLVEEVAVASGDELCLVVVDFVVIFFFLMSCLYYFK